MRLVFGLLACSALVVAPACSEEKLLGPPPSGSSSGGQTPETPDDERPASNPLIVDLGEIRAGTDVSFEVPEGALGFNVTVEGDIDDYDPDAPLGIERLVAPSGTVVHDDYTPKGGSRPTSAAIFDTIATVSVPQGDGVPEDLSGVWKLRIGQLGLTSSSVRARAKVRIQATDDGEFHGGKIDLHLHVPATLRLGDEVVDPSKAASHPGMKRRVDGFFSLTSRLLGIERGEVVWHTESSTFASIDTIEKLLNGFAISKGAKDGTQAFHILFTNRISIDGGEGGEDINALGVAPGIPGAATIFGRGVSGIIVATTAGVQEDVLTMIHEAGHFFGLNHTTELAGETDPLSDTPACINIDPKNLGACPDLSNVMFVAGAQASSLDGVTLSPSQKRVYQGSPIYKAFASGTPKTMSLDLSDDPFLGDFAREPLQRRFRLSGGPLSPVEAELSAGFCGLTRIDASSLARRHGHADTIAQLRAASQDPDLLPFVRDRARSALKSLGAQ